MAASCHPCWAGGVRRWRGAVDTGCVADCGPCSVGGGSRRYRAPGIRAGCGSEKQGAREHHRYLDEELLTLDYAASVLDLNGARRCVTGLLDA